MDLEAFISVYEKLVGQVVRVLAELARLGSCRCIRPPQKEAAELAADRLSMRKLRENLKLTSEFHPACTKRNVGLGVGLRDPSLALRSEAQFSGLVRAGHLVRVPGA